MQAQARWRVSDAEWAALSTDERDKRLAWEVYLEDEETRQREQRIKRLLDWREDISNKDALDYPTATAILIAGLE